MADICRFCFSEEQDENNPFISPCLCIGSVKYVHRDCLSRWRAVVTIERHKAICQACNTPFNLPRRWPLEVLPPLDKLWTLILSQSYIFVIFVHYAHIMLLLNGNNIKLLPEDPIQTALLIHNPFGMNIYNSLLFLVTTIYFLYYAQLFRSVVNRPLYIYYCTFDLTVLTIGCAVSIYLTQFTIFPFGCIYLYLLCRYHAYHYQTLLRINAEGTL